MKHQETHIYIKTECLQNKVRHSIILGQKEKALGAKRKVLALIKSLNYARVKRYTCGVL
jgi:hypothetical protein